MDSSPNTCWHPQQPIKCKGLVVQWRGQHVLVPLISAGIMWTCMEVARYILTTSIHLNQCIENNCVRAVSGFPKIIRVPPGDLTK